MKCDQLRGVVEMMADELKRQTEMCVGGCMKSQHCGVVKLRI